MYSLLQTRRLVTWISFADMGTPGGNSASIGTASGNQLYGAGNCSIGLISRRNDSTTVFMLKLCVSSIHWRSNSGGVGDASMIVSQTRSALGVVGVAVAEFHPFFFRIDGVA